MNYTIRQALPSDIPRIIELLYQVEGVHQQGRPDLFRKHGIKYTEQEVLDIINTPSSPIFVADLDGVVIGHIFTIITDTKDDSCLFDMRSIHLEDICVDEAYRGMGVGGALMEYVILWSKTHRCDRMDLDVWEFNEGARRFYERYGFKVQKRRLDMWIK